MTEQYTTRFTLPEDARYLSLWLMDPQSRRGFPMCDEVEVDDAVKRWMAFARYKCSLTVEKEGTPVAIGTLFLQPYRQLAHTCEFGIIVDTKHRNQKIGDLLLKEMIQLAKETFKIEILHLQVFGDNAAMRLYRRFGFREFGRQSRWLKTTDGVYCARVLMEKILS